MKLVMGKEHVIVRGMRPEENPWGAYQFPRPYNLDGRLIVAVHVADDDISSFGKTNRWFESRDTGESWSEIDASIAPYCGLLLPDGDRLYFPMESGIRVDRYKPTPQALYTPDYDFSRQAERSRSLGLPPIKA